MKYAINTDVINIFWKNINKTNYCWNWIGTLHSKNKNPVIRWRDIANKISIEYYARRISLEICNLPTPNDKKVITICGNNLCVNPDHLVIGDSARFWAKVQKLSKENGGCWIWIGAHDKNGYGKFAIRKDKKKFIVRAHHYSWFLTVQRQVPNGICLCHTCDTPSCVNPDHLFLGTKDDNNQDMVNKNRHPHGETHGNSKLKEIQIKDIKNLLKSGISCVEISKFYHVKSQTINGIKSGKSWAHIKCD